ncbi:MAG: K(+)-transporting ATPase subunit C [Syntrophales bacterium]
MKTTEYLKELRTALAALLVLAVILCGAYPLAVWGIGQAIFPNQANGTLIQLRGKTVGSSLIAQGFQGAVYFHPRPSAAGQGYDATSSGGSNLGPTSQKLIDSVKERIAVYRSENNLTPESPVPADAVTSSGSGLDPHISVQNARLQAPRVAKARGMSREALRQKIDLHTEGRDLGIFGEPRVNVLILNLDLDNRR